VCCHQKSAFVVEFVALGMPTEIIVVTWQQDTDIGPHPFL
jgi:hypothetical protein